MQATDSTTAQQAILLPASHAQQRIWFLDRLEQDGAAYNVPLIKRLRGPLNVDALERALAAVVERHEPLRTTFTVVDGTPHQLVGPPQPVRLAVTDLCGLPHAEEHALELVGEQARRRFDLAVEPPVRWALVKLGDQDHVLALTLHHIVADGWSMTVLSSELSLLYGAFAKGRALELPDLPIQYADYAVWQREWIESGGLDQQLEYWKRELAGAPALLELPTDRSRPARQSFRGATVRKVLPEELLAQLKVLGEREHKTLFMTMLAVFVTLLHRYSRQEDIVVASPVANRNRVELEGLIGLFVNTLALRTKLDDDPTFRELLRRVQETALGAFSNQDLPFEKLVEELNPERSLSYPPVAQVMFMFQSVLEHPVAMPGLEQERLGTDRGTAKFDLTMNAGEVPDGLRISLEYCTDLFEEATARRMLEHFETLLEAVVANPDARLHELELLTDAELRQLLVEWNDTAAPYPERLAHELVAAQAHRTPEAIAVQYEDERLSYAELDARSNQLAHHLTALGVGPDVPVGICVERSLEMVLGVLGILKAGGAYVPIDPAYPSDRQAYMLADSAAPVVVTQDRVRGQIGAENAVVVSLDSDWPTITAMPTEAPSVSMTPEHLSYLVYTSGSTGKPKGVQLTHRSLVNLLSTMRDAPGLSPRDVLLAVTTLSFDIASLELLLPLICGARVAIAPGEAISDPKALIALIGLTDATALQATPTTWRILVDAGWEGRPGLKAITGGEALPPALADELIDRGLELWNGYGPSETTIYSTRAHIESKGGRITIGRPVANTRVYILDEKQRPVPVGLPGELWIGGVGLARGYRGQPDLTAERFVSDPFAGEPGARMYRTGDRARYLPDSAIEYLGRIDHQVKIRGFRIEPGEIEATLREHPAVHEALVVARDEGGDRRLVAYVIGDGETPDAAELRAQLQRSLPDFMVPSAFVTLDAFPLTPNGKIDRSALPAPDQSSRATAEYVAPASEFERSLAELWGQVLGIERVGVQDNFFSLGGHSLLATKLVSRLREMLDVEVPLRALFEEPTIAGFATAVDALRAPETTAAALPPLASVPRQARRLGGSREDVYVLPVSYAEQRLWFLDRFEPYGGAYNMLRASRLRGSLDVKALERALATVVARHESLRTTFAVIDNVPHQVIWPARAVKLPVIDLSGQPDAQDRAQRLVGEESGRSFDLEAGPLLRGTVLRLGAEEHIVMLAMHHIVTDMWSLGVLGRELSTLYGAFLAGREPDLPELPLQYGDFAAWQQDIMQTGSLDEQLAYWKRELADAPALLELPTDHPRPSKQSFRGAVVRNVLPLELMERLRALSGREGTTMFMTLLAAFMTLLHRHSGQEDIVVASPIANRGRVELEGVIGCFLNTLALRGNLAGEPSFVELLHQLRETALAAFSNQDLPFEKLVEELNPERHLSHAPLAQAMFVLQNEVQTFLELPGLVVVPAPSDRRTAKFDLSMFAVESPEGLRVSIEYCSDLFNEMTAGRMLDHFRVLLEAITADPTRAISQLPLLGDAESGQLLLAFNAVGPAAAGARPVHELVAEQARRTPNACAVALGSQRLSYAALDARANKLAHHLRDLGVKPDVVVAVCTERSPEMATAVLAVLKAGGAYAPIDPGYPEDRTAFMLADTDTSVVLTQQHLRARLPDTAAQVVCLDSDLDLTAARDDTPPEKGATLDHLAYVIYTSGSTGRPKGVAMTHRPLANLLAWQLESWSPPSAACTLQFASLSFDVAFQELFSTWCSGGTLVLVGEDTRRDPAALLRFMAAEGVQRLFVPFVALHNLCEAAEQQEISVPSLRDIITAGEQLKITASIRSFFASHPECALFNQYGPTESHVVTAFKLTGPAREWPALPPIGRPIPGAKVHVLDRHLQPVPVGVSGELCIGGVSLARGYLSRPELTNERFVPDPFSVDRAARLYRTGDLARYRTEGTIDYLGRFDDQVKVRGYRIEPGEIEANLREHPTVREALVTAREDEPRDRRLVAYVVSDEPAPGATEMRDFLTRMLPEYMIPSAFVMLDAFPVSANGKVDRLALPAADDLSRATALYVAPSMQLERELADLWHEILGTKRIGVDDNFFALGGHSLLAVQLVQAVQERLGRICTLSMVFRNPTVRGLATELQAGGADVTTPTILKLQGDGQGPPLFCICGVHVYQQLADALAPDIPVYGVFLPVEQELFSPGPAGNGSGSSITVEEIAGTYLEAVREQQPSGPYSLLGFCFGGIIAYEMAQQLQRAGEKVALLTLLDSSLPGTWKTNPARVRLRRMKRRTIQGSTAFVNSIRASFGLPTSGPGELERLTRLRARIYGTALRRYELEPRDGSALLLQAESTLHDPDKRIVDRTFGWGRYISQLDALEVPGGHQTHLQRPAVESVAAILRPYLERARAKSKGEAA